MTLVFKWDQRGMHRVRVTRKSGTEIHRGCLVTNIPVVNSVSTGTDASVFLKAIVDTQCPIVGLSTYPTTIAPFSSAILDEIVPESIGKDQPNNSARIDFIYRINLPQQDQPGGGSGNTWTVTEGGEGSYVECYGTADGSKALRVWYKKGEASSTTSRPHNAVNKYPRTIHQFHPARTLRVTGTLLRSDWLAARPTIRAIRGFLNSTAWGGSSDDTRGKWMFLFPIARTSDFGKSFLIELNFVNEVKGHFPVGLYFDEHGNHPSDCATEADIRGGGLPAVNNTSERNGISLFSIQPETNFNSIFSFTPDD